MKKLFAFLRDRHALLFKGFLFVLTLLLIVYFFPGNSGFRYDLSNIKGQPWTYDNLIAPFDFAIQKSPEEVANEKADIRKNFVPYFRVDELSVIRSYDAQGLSKSALDTVHSVLKRGIRPITYDAGKKILFIRGNIAEEHAWDEFPDPIEADSIIKSKLNASQKKIWAQLAIPVTPNLIYDSILSQKSLQQSLDNISLTRGAFTKGQIIVSRGEIVTDDVYRALLSLRDAYKAQQRSSSWLTITGQVLIVALCLFLLFQFIRLFRRDILANDAQLIFILLLVVLTVLMAYIPSVIDTVPLLALPFCILPVIMRAFFDPRLALFVHLVALFIISSTLGSDRFTFLIIEMLAGITAIFSIVNLQNRSQLLLSVVAILATYMVLEFSLAIISGARADEIRFRDFENFAISALLVLLAYPLIFFFEKLFGFVSEVTLLELCDTNHPLLRELAEKAPGTFQHSMQVANLAEEALRRIGGNTLLIRAGAFYHDIGKGDLPQYFIENQATGVNPHDELTFEESATIIISHVIRGVEKAKARKLPDEVIDFIRTHHGTTNTAYFLSLYKKNNPEEFVDEELFRYPGPVPYSKETAVLMMADAVEASSRSLKKYDGESIDGLVERIIDHQADQKQFDNSDITLKEITAIKKIFKKKLRSIYHVRVEYPA